ncbi:flavin reductase family protein [Candidatus Bathyarchaeota archaeon]|nr:flavin reductase family protein [Candidatus Bathyarchaeota archaeon]
MEAKKSISVSSSYRLLHPMHTVLVTCAGKTGKANIITLAWAMPTSIDPPLVAISIAPARFSHELIEETKEFIVNIPTMDILNETFACGRTSGRVHDKFKETGLTPLPARKVKAPIIGECVAHLECRLHSQHRTGDHTIFVGEIIEAYADHKSYQQTYDLNKARMIIHMGGSDFATLEPKIHRPEPLKT